MTGAARILAIGQRPEVLDAITDELTNCGFDATGVPLAAALDGVEGDFDVVSFGGGVPRPDRLRLEEWFRSRRPDTRFVRSYAPYAASQIAAALRPKPDPLVDLDAYFRRISYHGPREPTIEVLWVLQALHIAAIPFEAIDVLLGRGIDIAPGAVDAKLIGTRRGGYCFEQNSLFKRVLTTIGFHVEPLVARVRWNAEPGLPPGPPTHMALRVEVGGVPWLVDVGFGANVPAEPLRLDITGAQRGHHAAYRLITFGAGFLLQASIGEHWAPLYHLSSEMMLDSDYELFNWFTSTHPGSHFNRDLIVAKTTSDARYALLHNRLTIRRRNGVERDYLDADALEQTLGEVFGLEVEDSWRPLIERAAERSTVEE